MWPPSRWFEQVKALTSLPLSIALRQAEDRVA